MQNNKKIIHVLIGMCVLFLSLVGYLTYFELFVKEKIITSSYNRRQWEREDDTLRGTIYDRNGVVLARSEMRGEKQERLYPHGSLYSHVIGYNSRSYGKSMLEARFNKYLLNVSEFNAVLDLKEKWTGEQKVGDDLYLTIDHELQAYAEKLLQGRNGAVVAMDPKTGEVLAMVSKPDFNPNNDQLTANWQKLVESTDNPFVPRATKGLYAPGSTFKVAVSAAAIENGLADQTFEDKGSIVIDGRQINNFGGKAYGTIGLTRALAVSSNTVFARLGVQLGTKNLKALAQSIRMNEKIPFDLPVNQSRFPYKSMEETDMAATGMGQGQMLVSPLHMAMIASTIANGGNMVKPYLVGRVITPAGYVLRERNPGVLEQVMAPETAVQVNAMMQEVVKSGTGTRARISGISVAGKTGTAENELTGKVQNKDHAWFIGFAPAEDPQIAVAVILEYAGSTGGKIAAPIARDLMAEWIKS